jgi:plastocyanin
MVNTKIIVGVVLLVAVITGIYMFTAIGKNPINTVRVIDNPGPNPGNTVKVIDNPSVNLPETTGNVIEMTSSGFSPKTLNISKGDTVTWINKDTTPHWPASAMHPTHTVYPGSNIEKCGTSEQGNIFDACRGLAQGESYSFTFNEVGSWGYHDHLNSNLFGKIVVK